MFAIFFFATTPPITANWLLRTVMFSNRNPWYILPIVLAISSVHFRILVLFKHFSRIKQILIRYWFHSSSNNNTLTGFYTRAGSFFISMIIVSSLSNGVNNRIDSQGLWVHRKYSQEKKSNKKNQTLEKIVLFFHYPLLISSDFVLDACLFYRLNICRYCTIAPRSLFWKKRPQKRC
jgi:hypothetical protein